MRTQLANEFSSSALDERSSSDVSSPPPAARVELPETSVVELSAILIVVLTGIVLTFTGATIALLL
jgi:hypothetical protein